MRLWSFVLRSSGLLAMACWIGGLAVYGALVLPFLHERFGVSSTAPVTRHVTLGLNAIGLAALVLGWIEFETIRRGETRRWAWFRVGLLAVSSAILAAQFVMHAMMSGQMDSGRLAGFYPIHRVYLVASTAQWFVNMAILVQASLSWRPDRSRVAWPDGGVGVQG